MSKLQNVIDIVVAGRAKKVESAVQAALDDGVNAADLLTGMIDAMGIVGDRFKEGEIFVPEMLVSAKAMKKGVDMLKPYLGSGEVGAFGKVVIGTVAGDLHDIGKNLVAMMIESAGFEVIDLGVDVAKEKFVEAVLANPGVKIVALSALLTTTMPALKEAVELLNQQSFRQDIKIMVGGAPLTAAFAQKIGADAYTADATTAAEVAVSYCT